MKPKKKNRTPLFAALIILMAFALLIVFSLTVWFPIQNCQIVGESHYTPEQLATALGLGEVKQNLFTADLAALADKLCQALPYIESAELRRSPPSTLRVTLKESAPAFYMVEPVDPDAEEPIDKLWWLMDANGKLLERAAEIPESALPVTGAALMQPEPGKMAEWASTARPDALPLLLRLLGELELREQITEVRLGVDPTPELMYQERIRIIFGPMPKSTSLSAEEVLRGKLEAAMEIIAQERLEQKGIVDLSIFGEYYFTPDWNI